MKEAPSPEAFYFRQYLERRPAGEEGSIPVPGIARLGLALLPPFHHAIIPAEPVKGFPRHSLPAVGIPVCPLTGSVLPLRQRAPRLAEPPEELTGKPSR